VNVEHLPRSGIPQGGTDEVGDDNLTVDEYINQILEVKLKNIAVRLGMSDKVISETVVSSADFIRIVMKRVTQTISQEARWKSWMKRGQN
jgi:hypothetical protein